MTAASSASVPGAVARSLLRAVGAPEPATPTVRTLLRVARELASGGAELGARESLRGMRDELMALRSRVAAYEDLIDTVFDRPGAPVGEPSAGGPPTGEPPDGEAPAGLR